MNSPGKPSRDEVAAISQKARDRIMAIKECADGYTWTWTPHWPANSPTMTWTGRSLEEARAAWSQAQRIWERDMPSDGLY